MNSFSQRKGLKPIKSIMQVDSMDDDLRNGLWNALQLFYWNITEKGRFGEDITLYPKFYLLITFIWRDYFKTPIEDINRYWAKNKWTIKKYFYECTWHEVYDFIEFVANCYDNEDNNAQFMDFCNHILEREVSAYRFVGGVVTQLTSEEEIEEIEKVLNSPSPLRPVSTHLKTALDLLSDKSKPDYRNSIKESISAVESMCNLITGGKDTLGEALKKVETKVAIHPALKKGFSNIYGYTNDASGIRHALLDEHNLDFEDAKFMLVSCSAFINYLVSKASKSGITF